MGFKGRLSAIVVVGGIFFLYVLSIQATALTKLKIGFNEGKTIRKAHDDAPANLLWVVQMSDIHISKWTPERGKALRKSLGHALKLIKPSLVWVTGDLTDAKNKDRTATRQDEAEWIEYWDSFQQIADDSGLPIEFFFDMRGNHDKYGVPLFSPLEYFSKYSISGHLNRRNLVQNITILGGDGQKHLFVGMDDAMHIGLRGPSNLFGHPTDASLTELDHQLSQWDHDTSHPVTKIVFGHFPMSFTTSTETGKRPEEIFAKHNISAYVCGHLHTAFGRHLYKHHKLLLPEYNRVGQFWEWEMGDWRVSRMMRVMATDNGHTSFVDVELIPPKDKSDQKFVMPTIILPTFPLNSVTMLKDSTKILPSDPVKVLVFSETPPVWVKARILDGKSRTLNVVEEISMQLVEYKSGDNSDSGPYYYQAAWDSAKYADNYASRYWLEIILEEVNGGITISEPRPFSVNGHSGHFRLTWLGYLVMGFRWETLYPFLLWGIVGFVLSLLVIPMVFKFQLEKRGLHEEWIMSVFRPAPDFRTSIFKVVKVPFWVVLENARNMYIWALLLVYVVYLVFLPWFSGRVLADDFPIGHLSLWGWSVKPSNSTSVNQISGLGVPDIMGIVLPYLYAVLFPLILMLSALSAERAACEYHIAMSGRCSQSGWNLSPWVSVSPPTYETDDVDASLSEEETASVLPSNLEAVSNLRCESQSEGELETLLLDRKIEQQNGYCSLCNRSVRKGLFVGCLAITFLHWRLLSSLLSAYGSTALVTTPLFAWTVPALIVFSIIQTSPIRPISAAGHEN